MTDPLKQLLKVAPDDARDIKAADKDAVIKEIVDEINDIMKGYSETVKLLALSNVAKKLAERSKNK